MYISANYFDSELFYGIVMFTIDFLQNYFVKKIKMQVKVVESLPSTIGQP